MGKKIKIPKKELLKLYYKENKSKYKIGRIYNCSFSTVLNRMREYGMEPVHKSIIQSKYSKKNFSGNKKEMAYIIGFRLGDLNVYRTNPNSLVVVARCHTTKLEQVDVMNNVFSQYGQVTCKKNEKDNSYSINCFLNETFNFLLKKKDQVEDWISADNNFSTAFAAGYIDAEANIGVYDGRARFKIDGYDKNIIKWFFTWFCANKIKCPAPKIIGVKGKIYNKSNLYKYNENVWRVRVSERESLEILLKLIKPYLKHQKRLKDLNECLININGRKPK